MFISVNWKVLERIGGKMNWKEKVLAGMELIAQGCEENGEWGLCNQCPFTDYCDSIWRDNNANTPKTFSERFYKKVLTNSIKPAIL